MSYILFFTKFLPKGQLHNQIRLFHRIRLFDFPALVKIRYLLSKIVKIHAMSRKNGCKCAESRLHTFSHSATMQYFYWFTFYLRIRECHHMMKIIHNEFDQCLAVLESTIDDANNWHIRKGMWLVVYISKATAYHRIVKYFLWTLWHHNRELYV